MAAYVRHISWVIILTTELACSYRRTPADAAASPDTVDERDVGGTSDLGGVTDRPVGVDLADGPDSAFEPDASTETRPSSPDGPVTLSNGVPCATDGQCTSDHCVDGVCCESDCVGQCQACAEATSAGKCVAVVGSPRGAVRPACSGQGVCASRCDGSDTIQCHNPGNEVQCAGPICTGGVAKTASLCDRAGACTEPASVPCMSGQCADGIQCSGGCGVTQPCASGQYCEPTTKACLMRKSNGTGCTSDLECSAGNCTDGVCCETRCGGQCQACAEAGMLGRCVTVAGVPRGTARTACGGQGTCASRCNGTDAIKCNYPGAETQCSGATCALGSSKVPSVCDGAGACTSPSAMPCPSNQCADALRCSTGCSATAPCAAGQYCDAASKACLTIKVNGAACTSDAQCSLACVDGVCCDSRCAGQCQACAESGQAGKCVIVTGAPRGTIRPACAGQGTCASRCDGSDATQCRYPGSSVQCAGPMCSAGAAKAASVCNAAGACTVPPAMSCASNQCLDTTQCSGGCSATLACATGQYCDATSRACLPLKANGSVCVARTECISNSCVDGVCCNTACSGQCEACAEPTSRGTCIAVSGAPRGNVRPACGGTRDICRGMCDAASRTQCRYPGAATECVPASCTSGTLTNASVCNTLGDCTAQTSAPCTSTQCAATGARCLDCTVTPCAGNFYCAAGGVCRPKIGNGPCQGDIQCSSNHCANGVCCNEACNDGCHACNLPASSGTCVTRFTEYVVPGGTDPFAITVGSDRNIWFTDFDSGLLGKVGLPVSLAAPVTISSRGFAAGNGLTSGPDGRLWFVDDENFSGVVGNVTTDLADPRFVVVPPTNNVLMTDIVRGADNNMWAANFGDDTVLKVSTAGTILNTYSVASPYKLTVASDGNVWITSRGLTGSIGRITPAGTLTLFPLPSGTSATHLAEGSDHAIWFTSNLGLGRMTLSGVVTNEYPLPPASTFGITSGPDGAIWFINRTVGQVGRIDVGTRVIRQCPIPTPASFPSNIVTGPDGNLWFTESSAVRIGRFIP